MPLIHLVLISLWAGVVLIELIMEIVAARSNDRSLHASVAQIHFWADVLVEIPLILGVLLTGAMLTARAWPLAALLQLKIGLGLVAIAVNLYCIVFVILRRQASADSTRASRYQRHVLASIVGVPFGLAAGYIGLAYFA